MKMYLAGNFVFLSDPEKEKMLATRCIELYGQYHRLTSFFFQKETDTVLTVIKEINSENEHQ